MTPEERVRQVIGWPSTGSPTDGWMRSALDVLGDHTRGVPMTRAQLLARCRAAGLDLLDRPARDSADEVRR